MRIPKTEAKTATRLCIYCNTVKTAEELCKKTVGDEWDVRPMCLKCKRDRTPEARGDRTDVNVREAFEIQTVYYCHGCGETYQTQQDCVHCVGGGAVMKEELEVLAV